MWFRNDGHGNNDPAQRGERTNRRNRNACDKSSRLRRDKPARGGIQLQSASILRFAALTRHEIEERVTDWHVERELLHRDEAPIRDVELNWKENDVST